MPSVCAAILSLVRPRARSMDWRSAWASFGRMKGRPFKLVLAVTGASPPDLRPPDLGPPDLGPPDLGGGPTRYIASFSKGCASIALWGGGLWMRHNVSP